jgi:BolA protein
MIDTTTDLVKLIRERLAALAPLSLEIEDDSARHHGHAGNQSGAAHFKIQIVAVRFKELSLIERHRLVYDLLQDLIPYPIHALVLKANSP